MDSGLIRRYVREYVKEAIVNSDGTTIGVSNYLREKVITGFLVQHRKEKERALEDARRVFDEHRHWPVQLVLPHLGLSLEEVQGKP